MKTYKTTYRLCLKNSLLRLGTAFVMFAVVAGAFSEGFRNPTIGTFGLGRSGGRIAQVDDSTAVQQNPANLIGITNAEIQLTPSVVYISADFQSTTVPGQSASTKDPWKLLPNFFASVPLKNDQVVVGIYAGAVGYLGFNGDMDVAIAIRTGVIKDNMLYVQAGAGIVADSIPHNEWVETQNKARAVLRAAELVQAGLDLSLS